MAARGSFLRYDAGQHRANSAKIEYQLGRRDIDLAVIVLTGSGTVWTTTDRGQTWQADQFSAGS
jgi:hypothetical protein